MKYFGYERNRSNFQAKIFWNYRRNEIGLLLIMKRTILDHSYLTTLKTQLHPEEKKKLSTYVTTKYGSRVEKESKGKEKIAKLFYYITRSENSATKKYKKKVIPS